MDVEAFANAVADAVAEFCPTVSEVDESVTGVHYFDAVAPGGASFTVTVQGAP